MNSLLISSGLPGGMMGSLMSDLEKSHLSINKWLKKNKSDEINIDFLFSMLSDEVNEIWPKMGYPPLVTPYSQYVKNVALAKGSASPNPWVKKVIVWVPFDMNFRPNFFNTFVRRTIIFKFL